MGVAEDRVSELPDHLIAHILSILPIKDAVKTSVLSRRWVNLWTFLPTLHLEQGNILTCRRDDHEHLEMARTFSAVVDRCLLSPDSLPLRLLLQIVNLHHLTEAKLEEWIPYIFSKDGLRVLSLGLHSWPWDDECSVCLDVPKLLVLSHCKSFHSLISIDLYGLWVTEDLIKHLTVNCRFLEDLKLSRCAITGNITICADSHLRLKNVTIEYCNRWEQLDIVASNLQSFAFTDRKFSTKRMHLPSLSTAVVDFIEGGDGSSDGTAAFSEGLANVSLLEFNLCAGYRSRLFKNVPLPFQFLNLVQLRLSFHRMKHHRTIWSDLWILLAACPCLQTLVFMDKFSAYYRRRRGAFYRPNDIPDCLIHHLKTVEVNRFQGREDEMQFIAFMFKVAFKLERVQITIMYDAAVTKDQIAASIAEMPKKSSTVKVTFHVGL